MPTVLNPHLKTDKTSGVFPTQGIPLTQVGGVYQLPASYWTQQRIVQPYGAMGWEFCSEAEIPAHIAAVLKGSPAPFKWDDGDELAEMRIDADQYLAQGWEPTSLALRWDLKTGGFSRGQIEPCFYAAGYLDWLEAAQGRVSKYRSALKRTLLAIINNPDNDALRQPGVTGNSIYQFHASGPYGLIGQVLSFCGRRVLGDADFLRAQTWERKQAWRLALDEAKYFGINAAANHLAGDYSDYPRSATAINVDGYVDGAGRNQPLCLFKRGDGTRVYPSRWCQSNSHPAGNQAQQPLHYAALTALRTGDDLLLALVLRMLSMAMAYCMTPDGHAWDMYRGSEQTGRQGPSAGGMAYYVEILQFSAVLSALLHRLGKPSMLDWRFDTGFDDIPGWPGSATRPRAGTTKQLQSAWNNLRDMVGGVADIYVDDGTTARPTQAQAWPCRVIGNQFEGQWLSTLMLMHHVDPTAGYDRAVRRIGEFATPRNVWPAGTFNPAWGPRFHLAHSPATPVIGAMCAAALQGSTGFEARNGRPVFTAGAAPFEPTPSPAPVPAPQPAPAPEPSMPRDLTPADIVGMYTLHADASGAALQVFVTPGVTSFGVVGTAAVAGKLRLIGQNGEPTVELGDVGKGKDWAAQFPAGTAEGVYRAQVGSVTTAPFTLDAAFIADVEAKIIGAEVVATAAVWGRRLVSASIDGASMTITQIDGLPSMQTVTARRAADMPGLRTVTLVFGNGETKTANVTVPASTPNPAPAPAPQPAPAPAPQPAPPPPSPLEPPAPTLPDGVISIDRAAAKLHAQALRAAADALDPQV